MKGDQKMKIKRKELEKWLKTIRGIMKSSNLPALQFLLFKDNKIFATNLTSCAAFIHGEIENKSFCLQYNDFQKIIATLKEDYICLNKEEDRIIINNKYKLSISLDPDEHPVFPALPDKEFYPLSIENLDKLRRIPKESYGSYDYSLSWLAFEEGCFLASDGARLYNSQTLIKRHDMKAIGLPPDFIFLILQAKKAFGDLSFTVHEKWFFAKFNKGYLVHQLPESPERTPPYMNFLKKQKNKNIPYFVVGKKELINVVDEASIILDESYPEIVIKIEDKKIIISSHNPNKGKYSSKVLVKETTFQKEMTVALNNRYLIEALKDIESPRIKIAFENENSAVILEGIEKKMLQTTQESLNIFIMPMLL
jgi:DNA polymerase III sliding clamp (beta) subunit (PCNA family)